MPMEWFQKRASWSACSHVGVFAVATVCLVASGGVALDEPSRRGAWKPRPVLRDPSGGAALGREELVRTSAVLKQQIEAGHRRPVTVGKQTAGQPSPLSRLMQSGRRQSLRLSAAASGTDGWDITWNERNGTPVFISTSTADRIAGKALGGGLPGAAPEGTALAFVTQHRDLFRLDRPAEELSLASAVTDRLGKRHVTFQQQYEGVPLWNQQIVAHVDPSGSVYAINGRYVPTPRDAPPLGAVVTEEEAIDAVRADLGSRSRLDELSPQSRSLLQYDGPRANQRIWVHPGTQQLHLVWHIVVRPNFRDRWYYFVDAHSGEILQRYNATATDGPTTAVATDLLGSEQTLHVYEAVDHFFFIDASRPMFQDVQPDILSNPLGAIWTLDARGTDLAAGNDVFHVFTEDNVWTDATAVSAHANTARVFEYYLDTHGRLGIDGEGGTMISIVHVTDKGGPMENAFWNGIVMAYGDGNVVFSPLAGAGDVAGHEMTHGVIERTVNLEYTFQSGALNESFADVFGAMVDREDWQIGEDVTSSNFFTTGALRDMSDPNNGGSSGDNGWQPAHMDEFVELDIETDNGGVHVNSGIPNRACFLIAEAIGRDKTEQIYYRILDARYLNSKANFVDMRLAARRAAAELFGDPSAELDAVAAAFDAVGIEGLEGLQAPADLTPKEGVPHIAFVNAADGNTLYLARLEADGEDTMVKLSATEVSDVSGNPVTVAADGSLILFVDADFNLRLVRSDGSREVIISDTGTWRSLALSPDGRKLATTTIYADTTIFVLDLVDPDASQTIKLSNPTTQDDLEANVVVFADAMSWDPNGEFLIYDAYNIIPQADGEPIVYWDVNILNVENELIVPLFPPQPRGLQLGNPSFANTNESFIVFDFVDVENDHNQVIVFDLFTGEGAVLESGDVLGFPSFAPDDGELIYERYDADTEALSLARIPLDAGRLERSGPTQTYRLHSESARWFVIDVEVDDPPTDVDEVETDGLPRDAALAQNYPNPFNASTVIRYELPVDAVVAVAIYDLVGRRVATVDAGHRNAGTHTARWDGTDRQGRPAASGVYLYELTTTAAEGSARTGEARKMVLLR